MLSYLFIVLIVNMICNGRRKEENRGEGEEGEGERGAGRWRDRQKEADDVFTNIIHIHTYLS